MYIIIAYLHRKLTSSFSSPVFYNITTTLSCLSYQKTMGSFSFFILRIVCLRHNGGVYNKDTNKSMVLLYLHILSTLYQHIINTVLNFYQVPYYLFRYIIIKP